MNKRVGAPLAMGGRMGRMLARWTGGIRRVTDRVLRYTEL